VFGSGRGYDCLFDLGEGYAEAGGEGLEVVEGDGVVGCGEGVEEFEEEDGDEGFDVVV